MAPCLITVIAGPAGSGKSLVGALLAARLGHDFADADDFHSRKAKAWMRGGQALTDEMRGPWLARLKSRIAEAIQAERPLILACSALRRSHREMLREGTPPGMLRFVWLDVPEPELRRRLVARKGHFFGAGLLASQLAAAEPLSSDEGMVVDGAQAPEVIAAAIIG